MDMRHTTSRKRTIRMPRNFAAPKLMSIQIQLEQLSTQILLVERTVKTMADELTEVRKISLEIKEQLIEREIFKLKEASTSREVQTDPMATISVDPALPQVKPVKDIKTLPKTTQPTRIDRQPSIYVQEKNIHVPDSTISGYLHPSSIKQLGLEESLWKIKEIQNWRQEFLKKDHMEALINVKSNLEKQSDKDLLVNFLKVQSDGMDLSRIDGWFPRLKIIIKGIEGRPDSILRDDYKQLLTDFVEYWRVEMQNDFEAIRFVVKGLTRVLQSGSIDESYIVAAELLQSISQRLSLEQRDELGKGDLISALVKLMNPDAQPRFLKNAWTFLRNITDDSSENCLRFCIIGGVSHFDSNYQRYKDDSYFLLNMFGVMANLVEVQETRRYVREKEHLEMVRSIVKKSTQPMELVVIAAGVLAQLISDGKEDWGPEYEACFDDSTRLLIEKIPSWTTPVKTDVNFTTLKPLSQLLMNHEQSCKLYAAWFIANLLSTNRDKYFPLRTKDNFLELLRNIYSDPNTIEPTNTLVGSILSHL